MKDLCTAIAHAAHARQKRRTGEPAIEHPQRVADLFQADSMLYCLAILHDVLEDSHETPQSLSRKGVPAFLVDQLDMLTHKPGTPYRNYIAHLCLNPTCAKVKLADILDNLCDAPTEYQKQKYRNAIPLILNALN